MGNGQIITPTDTQVDLGIRVRAKAIALNPNPHNHTAAVLTMGASEAVQVFDIRTGQVLQSYLTMGTDAQGSYSGITYSADGKQLMFSQDSSNVAVANVSDAGLLTDNLHISVPANNTFITCFPNSPMGDYGRLCGTFYSASTSYPGGVAFSKDGKSAYALLNQNNTL
ncbi:MAG: PD40 domain-containing protein, partial [Sinobacteraceae bacterium]|nr:PD40 domain-containing protein [Nevskiaceae bacterium]